MMRRHFEFFVEHVFCKMLFSTHCRLINELLEPVVLFRLNFLSFLAQLLSYLSLRSFECVVVYKIFLLLLLG